METDIESFIKRSGNTFHYNTAQHLRNSGFFNELIISPYYTDAITDKPREIDLIGRKIIPIKNVWQEICAEIHANFYIECKKVETPTAFWFDAKNKSQALELVIKSFNLSNEHAAKRHHYLLNDTVAKLFDSKNGRDIENQVFYKAINQSLNAMIYHKPGSPIKQRSVGVKGAKLPVLTVSYPVILCENFQSLFQVLDSATGKYAQIHEQFQVEINYAYRKDSTAFQEYFIVDVAEFSSIDKYFELVMKNDVPAMEYILQLSER